MLKSKAIAIRALGRRLHIRYNLTKLVDAVYEELFVQEIMSRLPEYIEKAKKARRRIPIPKRTPAATAQRLRLMTAEATLEHTKEVAVRFGEMRREVVGNLRKRSKDFYNWKRDKWMDKVGFDVGRWLFDRQKWRTILSEDNARLVGAQTVRSAEDAIEGYGIGRSFNQVDKRAIRWLAENAKNSGWSIADTTYDELRETLMEAVAEGWSIPTIAGRVESFFEDITAARAELIARTETLKGTNRGTLEGMVQSGVVEGKEWLCTEDDRTCDMCLEMDGKKMALENAFFEKGDTHTFGETEMAFEYEDIETPPLHPDCRCTLLAVFDEQAAGWKLNGLERDHLPENEIPEVGPERDDLCRKLIEKDYLQTYGTKLAREEAMSYRKAVEGFAAQDSAMIRYAQLGVRDMFSSDAVYEKYLELGNKIEDFIKFSAKFPKDTWVYRGIAEDELGLSRALVEAVKKTPTGSTIELKSTSHWTTDKLIAGRYDGEILFEVKSAKRAAAISHLSIFENEREVAVSKDCVFKIIKKSHKVIAGVKRWVITLEAV